MQYQSRSPCSWKFEAPPGLRALTFINEDRDLSILKQRSELTSLITSNCYQQGARGIGTREILDIRVPHTNAPSDVQLLQGGQAWQQ